MLSVLKYKKLRHKLEGLFGDRLTKVHVFRTKMHYNVVVSIDGKNVNCKFARQFVNALVTKHDIKDVEQEIASVIFQQMNPKDKEQGEMYEV